MKKTLAISLILTGALSAQATLAALPAQQPVTLPPAPPTNQGSFFAPLENYLGEMYLSVGRFITNENYQKDTGLMAIQTVNTTTASPTAFGAQQKPAPVSQLPAIDANAQTAFNIDDTLKQFRYAYDPEMTQTSDGSQSKIRAKDNTPFNLYMAKNSTATLASMPADDTLYVTGEDQNKTNVLLNPALQKPTVLYNSSFNFGNLITPTTYTPSEENAAKQFVVYAARSTQNLVGQVPFQKLRGNTVLLNKLKTDSVYAKFVVSIRHMLAIRSVNINTLNQLIAERTPVPNLAKKADLPKTVQGYPNASPLQVEAYQANHRIEDPNWYARVENSSPATVQRNTLIVLAEIEHQNYQAHLDRERILAAIAANNLQSSAQANDAMLLEQSSALTQKINELTTSSGGVQNNQNVGAAAAAEFEKSKAKK